MHSFKILSLEVDASGRLMYVIVLFDICLYYVIQEMKHSYSPKANFPKVTKRP